MAVLPQTTCRRCHRQYSSLRGSCPYCGAGKPKETRRPAPESDSAVKNSPARERAAETINWQFLFGGVILLAIVVAVLALVSSHVSKDVAEGVTSPTPADAPAGDVAATAIPTITPAPTLSPSPTPTILSLAIEHDYMIDGKPGFTANVGDQVQLKAVYYPVNAEVTVKWSSSDDSIATVDQTGLVTCVSGGNYCYIYAEVDGFDRVGCQVIVR